LFRYFRAAVLATLQGWPLQLTLVDMLWGAALTAAAATAAFFAARAWGQPKRFGAPSEITHLRLIPA